MRGHHARPARQMEPGLRLIAAMIRQALLEAHKGQAEAAEWLDTVGCEWAAAFFKLDIADWRARDPFTEAGQRRQITRGRMTWAERKARYGPTLRKPRPGEPGYED